LTAIAPAPIGASVNVDSAIDEPSRSGSRSSAANTVSPAASSIAYASTSDWFASAPAIGVSPVIGCGTTSLGSASAPGAARLTKWR
jgi:hypothetical protein